MSGSRRSVPRPEHGASTQHDDRKTGAKGQPARPSKAARSTTSRQRRRAGRCRAAAPRASRRTSHGDDQAGRRRRPQRASIVLPPGRRTRRARGCLARRGEARDQLRGLRPGRRSRPSRAAERPQGRPRSDDERAEARTGPGAVSTALAEAGGQASRRWPAGDWTRRSSVPAVWLLKAASASRSGPSARASAPPATAGATGGGEIAHPGVTRRVRPGRAGSAGPPGGVARMARSTALTNPAGARLAAQARQGHRVVDDGAGRHAVEMEQLIGR